MHRFILSHKSYNMISTKIATIIAIVAFVSGSFVASPELRADAAAMITSADIVNETIRSEDIKNGEVKSSDIATGAVGSNDIFDGGIKSIDIAEDAISGRELEGVDMFIIESCAIADTTSRPADGLIVRGCHVDHVHSGWSAIATINSVSETEDFECFVMLNAETTDSDRVDVTLKNICSTPATLGTIGVSIIAWR
jgi:hypothetical protein